MKKTTSERLTVQFTVNTSPRFNTRLDTVKSTSMSGDTDGQTGVGVESETDQTSCGEDVVI